jgi:hypothetical protein
LQGSDKSGIAPGTSVLERLVEGKHTVLLKVTLYQNNVLVDREFRPSDEYETGIDSITIVLIRQVIYDVLKANNYNPKTLSHKRQSAYIITEEFGVTLAILFQVLQPISKPDRIIKIAQSIAAMSYEEANYWFALITNGRSNALKAIGVLFD